MRSITVADRTIYCHGCGDQITATVASWHNGEGYCRGCEEAPADPEAEEAQS